MVQADGLPVPLLEHGARAHQIGDARMDADERVAELLELDRRDLLVVVAREETQVDAAEVERGDLGGDEVVDVGEDARVRRHGGRLRAEDRGELGLGDAAGLLALRDLCVIERGRRAAGEGHEHAERRREPRPREF